MDSDQPNRHYSANSMPTAPHKNKVHPLFVSAVFIALAVGMQSSFAFGLDEVYSPNAEFGEISMEVSHARSFDKNPAKDGAQVGEITLEAGLTPRFVVSVSGEYSANVVTSRHMHVTNDVQHICFHR